MECPAPCSRTASHRTPGDDGVPCADWSTCISGLSRKCRLRLSRGCVRLDRPRHRRSLRHLQERCKDAIAAGHCSTNSSKKLHTPLRRPLHAAPPTLPGTTTAAWGCLRARHRRCHPPQSCQLSGAAVLHCAILEIESVEH